LSKTELSYDTLLLKINDLTTKIVNEDIQKLAQNNSEIQETLKNYEKGNNVWSGADVIITEQANDTHKAWLGNQPLVISFQQFDAMKRLVVTQHAVELSWLFIQLRELYSGRIDHVSKYDFYGELAQKAIDIVNFTNDEISYEELLLAVLRQSKVYI
jgi:hypothetical protein